MTDFPEIIKDGDLELRHVIATFDTAREMFDIIDRNREYLGRFLAWPPKIQSPEDQFPILKRMSEKQINWLIFVGGKLVGTVGLVKLEPEKRRTEIGFWIDAEFAGRGIMTRGVRLVEDAVFATGEFDRIHIEVDELNIASQRVAEKVGYKFEGVLRSYDKMGMIASGDIRMYSKLLSEWKKQ